MFKDIYDGAKTRVKIREGDNLEHFPIVMGLHMDERKEQNGAAK